MTTNYSNIIKNLEMTCGCTHAAKSAAEAMRELIAQRDQFIGEALAARHLITKGAPISDVLSAVEAAIRKADAA